MPSRARNRAVVLGGSVAGLLAARVLAEHYTDVVVVERDRLPARTRHRRGIPHGHHVHGLLPHGLRAMEDLLPGITDDMVTRGALTGDVLGNVRWYLRGQALCQADAGLTVLSASRPLIEAAVRDRVRALPNVSLRDRHEATGLHLSADGQWVTGVWVLRLCGSHLLPADLVVDATGRGSRSRRWLGDLDFPAPPVQRVAIDLRYASCVFAATPAMPGDDLMVAVARVPGHRRRTGVMQRIEGDRVLVTLAGVRGDRPPLDPEGFADYADTLAVPEISHLVRSGRALTGRARFHCPTYERHRYEQVASFPAGLLVVGDAGCGFNPVYADGMTVAARTAAALREQLGSGDEPAAGPFFRAVSSILDRPWEVAVGTDRAADDTAPDAEYLTRLELAAAEDVELSTAVVRVAALVDPPSVLLSPAIRRRVARSVPVPL